MQCIPTTAVPMLTEHTLPFEEILMDLDTPRPQWYSDIDPKGLVPSIKYTIQSIPNLSGRRQSADKKCLCKRFPDVYGNEEIITESAIVA